MDRSSARATVAKRCASRQPMPQSHQIASPCKIGRTGSNPLAAPACALPASHRTLTKPQSLHLHHPRPHCKGPTTARTWP
eukprot:7157580-Prymnesium_polylepis.2